MYLLNFVSFSDLKTVGIWILGQELVMAAQKRAAVREFSEFLNFSLPVKLLWFCFADDILSNLFLFIVSSVNNSGSPDVLIIHVGENLIGRMRTTHLLWELKHQLTLIHNYLPSTFLIFSELIPHVLWFSCNLTYMNRIRKRINRAMFKFLPLLQGFSFRHVNIDLSVPGFFSDDFSRLSPVGLDMLNLDYQRMIELACGRLGGAKSV